MSGLDNRFIVKYRGKSGLHRAGCQITSGGGDSKESATEIIPPDFQVRVKWQCKRLPPRW